MKIADQSTLENQETERTTSPSEEVSFVETRTFDGSIYKGMKRMEYPSSEAFSMYQKVIKKYRATSDQILVCLRDKEDQLVKSELLNYPRGTNES